MSSRISIRYNEKNVNIQIFGINNEKMAMLDSLTGEPNDIIASDGYHTIEELYEHRHRLFLALIKIYDNYITPMDCQVRCWKSRKHDDGTMYEGSFIAGMVVTKPQFDMSKDPEVFNISYHLPVKYWDLAKVIELEKAPKYDGYTPDDVLERLLRL